MAVSERIRNLPVSSIRKLIPISYATKARGVKVYHLNIGDPDIRTPQVMLDALRNWSNPVIKYAPSQGTPEFLKACLSYYHKLGFEFLETSDIITTVGASEAMTFAFLAITGVDDEILTFEPFYSNYSVVAGTTGIKLVAVPTTLQNGFHLPSREVIESRITPRTKAILLCNPGNPTGTVFRRDEVELLVKIAKERNLYLISDEPYREYAFDTKTVSILEFMKDSPQNLILLDSLSKRYSLCGARLGMFITRNTSLIQGVMKLAMSRLSGGIIDQAVGTKLTEVSDDYIKEVIQEYKQRRDFLYNALKSIPGVDLPIPEGAFYVMVSLPVRDADHFAKWLLEHFTDNNETVMIAPGQGFYNTPGVGMNQVRIAYVLNISDLKRSVELLRKGLEQYSKVQAKL